MTSFIKVHQSCISNYLSSQFNPYVPVVRTGNDIAANGALALGECELPYKNKHSLVNRCTTCYMDFLPNVGWSDDAYGN